MGLLAKIAYSLFSHKHRVTTEKYLNDKFLIISIPRNLLIISWRTKLPHIAYRHIKLHTISLPAKRSQNVFGTSKVKLKRKWASHSRWYDTGAIIKRSDIAINQTEPSHFPVVASLALFLNFRGFIIFFV